MVGMENQAKLKSMNKIKGEVTYPLQCHNVAKYSLIWSMTDPTVLISGVSREKRGCHAWKSDVKVDQFLLTQFELAEICVAVSSHDIKCSMVFKYNKIGIVVIPKFSKPFWSVFLSTSNASCHGREIGAFRIPELLPYISPIVSGMPKGSFVPEPISFWCCIERFKNDSLHLVHL